MTPIFASPDLSGMVILLPIIGSVIPMFLLGALMHHDFIISGVLQAIFLLVALTFIWRSTRKWGDGWQIVMMLAGYFGANLGFTLLWFATIPLRVSLGIH
jgi:hypothetical protein